MEEEKRDKKNLKRKAKSASPELELSFKKRKSVFSEEIILKI